MEKHDGSSQTHHELPLHEVHDGPLVRQANEAGGQLRAINMILNDESPI